MYAYWIKFFWIWIHQLCKKKLLRTGIENFSSSLLYSCSIFSLISWYFNTFLEKHNNFALLKIQSVFIFSLSMYSTVRTADKSDKWTSSSSFINTPFYLFEYLSSFIWKFAWWLKFADEYYPEKSWVRCLRSAKIKLKF